MIDNPKFLQILDLTFTIENPMLSTWEWNSSYWDLYTCKGVPYILFASMRDPWPRPGWQKYSIKSFYRGDVPSCDEPDFCILKKKQSLTPNFDGIITRSELLEELQEKFELQLQKYPEEYAYFRFISDYLE